VGAAAFDRQGHLILALVNGEVGSFGSAIGGVLIASGGTEKPMLFFYRL
jgi:amino acid permease